VHRDRALKYVSSQLSGIEATEGVEAEANHHPLLIKILADEMNIKRMFEKLVDPHHHHSFFSCL